MSVSCGKCGADISFESEEHDNCDVVVSLRERVKVLEEELKKEAKARTSKYVTDYGQPGD